MKNYANPAALGAGAFALTTWLLSMVNAHWVVAPDATLVLPMALVIGGAAQMTAGLFEYPRGNTLGFTVFCFYGFFWISFGLLIMFFTHGVSADFIGWYLAVWGAMSVALTIASIRVGWVIFSALLFVALTYFFLAIGNWGVSFFTILGGYTGLIAAAIAFYIAMAEVVNHTFNAQIFPLFIHPKIRIYE